MKIFETVIIFIIQFLNCRTFPSWILSICDFITWNLKKTFCNNSTLFTLQFIFLMTNTHDTITTSSTDSHSWNIQRFDHPDKTINENSTGHRTNHLPSSSISHKAHHNPNISPKHVYANSAILGRLRALTAHHHHDHQQQHHQPTRKEYSVQFPPEDCAIFCLKAAISERTRTPAFATCSYARSWTRSCVFVYICC